MDRSSRTFLASGLLVLALLLGINYVTEGRSILDWWLPLALAVAGVVLALPGRARRDVEAAAETGVARAYGTREFTFDRPALIGSGGEQAGEVNVQEPRDEIESAGMPEATTRVLKEAAGPPAPVLDSPEPPPTAPESITPAPPPEAVISEEEREAERLAADMERAGKFVPPATAEETLNPPTESFGAAGVVVKSEEGPPKKDPVRHEMPLTAVEPDVKPSASPGERIERDATMIQPADTAENEFQSGEHVAANQPTTAPPITTQTTGEGMGAGVEPMRPQEKAVMDTTSAPPMPQDTTPMSSNAPDVVEAVVSGTEDETVSDALTSRDRMTPTSAASSASGAAADDLTVIDGIGKKMAAALRNAGIDSYMKLSMASDAELRQAIEQAGMRFAPTLTTWREQANFLARGDRAGFEAMKRALKSGGQRPESDE